MMNDIKKFSPNVCKELRHYVYRLVDPRTGKTFYVGKGQGNRVFDHMSMTLRFRPNNDDEKEYKTPQTEKYEVIKAIHNAGLEVIPIIHRHGIADKETAFAIEGALIDAYPGLTNVQAGHGNLEYGCAHACEVQNKYQAEEADLSAGKFVIIKLRQSTVDDRGGSVYDAVRRSWRINCSRVEGRQVIASVYGIIRDVFAVKKWYPGNGEDVGRWCFDGYSVADKHRGLIGKRLPQRFVVRGAASPIRYV